VNTDFPRCTPRRPALRINLRVCSLPSFQPRRVGRDDLLVDNSALARSAFNRFPYLEPLNHLQVELLPRYRFLPGRCPGRTRHPVDNKMARRSRSAAAASGLSHSSLALDRVGDALDACWRHCSQRRVPSWRTASVACQCSSSGVADKYRAGDRRYQCRVGRSIRPRPPAATGLWRRLPIALTRSCFNISQARPVGRKAQNGIPEET
jgi:hypothetical protein